jgi:glycosyltransferase involved in cell wall biosynthesis
LIFIYHRNKKIEKVEDHLGQLIDFDASISIARGLSHIAVKYPDSVVVWCAIEYREDLNFEQLNKLFHHNKLMLSYEPGNSSYLGNSIGYVDESLFVKINKKVSFPTWQMSSVVGMIHASVVLEINKNIAFDSDFNYYLNSLAKLAMHKGLFCYSEPLLLKDSHKIEMEVHSNFTLFRFVKQHYKTRWIFLLFFNLFLFENKGLLFPFLASFFYQKRNNTTINLEKIKVQSSRLVGSKMTIDVIIPTIGRKEYLYDVLCDLRKQTHMPENVIIVEQNPVENSKSELDYIIAEIWPFTIKHTFTHQAGACNARNLALKEVDSEWVFLADDDNRFNSELIKDVFLKIKKYGTKVITTSYPQAKESISHRNEMQSLTFGSGNSFLKSEILEKCQFNMAFEFGYGEDSDFGMQLRNLGLDVIYVPEPSILHLKAPIGGFRTKPVLEWHKDKVQPKPSPTVMLYILLHNSKQQLLGYKATLFFKFYRHQTIKNPYYYYLNYRKQWNRSVFWANELRKQNEI